METFHYIYRTTGQVITVDIKFGTDAPVATTLFLFAVAGIKVIWS